SASNAPPQATTGAADATIDHVGSQATKAAPDNNTQDIGATFDAPSAATRADGSPPSPGEATQVHTPTQVATSMAGGASPAAKPTPPAGKHSDRLGGYRILRELGRGAMGTVYLARQLSLDRNVALKTIQAHWANHPNVMARFTREAYAAAQLTHHNVVQIYDLGEDRGTPYFSMEFVRGMSLADLLERAGKLDARTAVGHTLQAARGLRFAHQQGMIHRDIKPANLMLDEHGVVKVADLGLVKAPEMLDLDDEADEPAASSTLASVTADVTMMNSAMGTPAYMAPEQAENAAGVDHRADIYSLGCTLYALLAGRPPFDGATALEVITKQKTQPVPRIESIDASIPQPLAEIVMRMVAKQPDERFANLDEVIEQLERFLAADGSASVPNEEHVATLETAVAEFHRSPAGKLRGLLATAFVGGCFGVALLALFWSFKISSGFLVMAVAATFGYFAITGVRERTTLFDKLRAWLFTARWSDWAVGLCGALLLLVIAWVGNCLIAWTVFAIVGVALAAGFHLTIDAMVRRQQQPPIDRVESMLKSLRLRGLDEVKLREFVAQYGGANWEGLFEAIFGYEAKLAARETITSGRRRKFRAWRDPLIRGIDARLAAHRAAREQRHLQKVEQASLRAKGVDPAAAREQAEQLAAAMVEQASEVRRAPVSAAPAAVDPKLAA
ncbi:MAG: serine/threonine protein kinase, partial [Planctomycetales bacterium]|nr:serine/threonine protein kinase [Planctomycetales bacterium]